MHLIVILCVWLLYCVFDCHDMCQIVMCLTVILSDCYTIRLLYYVFDCYTVFDCYVSDCYTMCLIVILSDCYTMCLIVILCA